MRYTVTFELRGALAAAVAVEWTEADIPADSGAGWRPCLRLPDGRWRLSSHDLAGRRPDATGASPGASAISRSATA